MGLISFTDALKGGTPVDPGLGAHGDPQAQHMGAHEESQTAVSSTASRHGVTTGEY